MIEVWILTFERPVALNRLVTQFGKQGIRCNVLSNSPLCEVSQDAAQYIDRGIINTLNDRESNAWCARAWNSIYLKGFASSDALVCIQDDTNISDDFVVWLKNVSQQYDFISGPAGDQFFYIKKPVFQKIGFWDERYIGCYAGDADYFNRVYHGYDKTKVSIYDTHNWGVVHNDCGVASKIITTYESKTVDPDYENQHWEFERISGCGGTTTETNPTIIAAQKHFKDKWGDILDNGKPVIQYSEQKVPELNWYPWATKKYGVTAYDN